MKKLSVVRVFLVLCLSTIFAGCTIVPKSASGDTGAIRAECVAVVTGVTTDIKACVIDVQAINPTTGKNDGNWGRRVDLVNNASLGGEVLKSAVGGVGAAYVQGRAAIKAAEAGKCGEGSNCGTTIINDGSANAGSTSQAVVDGVKVKVTVGTPTCGGSTCLKGD